MKKKILLMLALALTLTACQKAEEKKVESKKTVDTVKKEETKKETKEEKKEADGTFKLGQKIEFKKFDITIKSFSKVKDTNGKPVLKVVYDFTNKDEKPVTPFIAFQLKGFQDGVEVDSMPFVMEGVNLEKGQKEIKKGATITDADALVSITDEKKPLELELSESFAFSNEKHTMKLDLSTLK